MKEKHCCSKLKDTKQHNNSVQYVMSDWILDWKKKLKGTLLNNCEHLNYGIHNLINATFFVGELYYGYGECPYPWDMHAEVFWGAMALCLQLFLK